jgi:hypothetical protein
MLSPTINNAAENNSDSAYFSASLGDSSLSKKKKESQEESTPKSSLPKVSNNYTRKRLLFTNNLINEFNQTIFSLPSFECVVCRRIFYRDQTSSMKVSAKIKSMFANLNQELGNEILVCKTCRATVAMNKIPAYAFANSMDTGVLPAEISSLNDIEANLISRVKPFMKIFKYSSVYE